MLKVKKQDSISNLVRSLKRKIHNAMIEKNASDYRIHLTSDLKESRSSSNKAKDHIKHDLFPHVAQPKATFEIGF